MAVMAYLRGGDPEAVAAEFAWEYAILEGPITADFVRRGQKRIEWEKYDKGVLFGKDCETQWRRRTDGTIHFVVKGEVTPGPAWMGGKELKLWKKHGATVVLWGEPDARAGGWYEARIPKALPYDFAAAAGRRVAIRTRNYRAPDGSEITRYVGVEVM